MPGLTVGNRVCVDGVQSRPELNGLAGVIISADRVRCGVRLEGSSERVSLRRSCLTREDIPPWDRCRHGGPTPEMAVMQEVGAYTQKAWHLSTPCLQHVRLLEPIVRTHSPPPLVLASMATDAFIASDMGPCRCLAVGAVVLRAAQQVGADALYADLARGGTPPAESVQQLEAELGRCVSVAGLLEVLKSFCTCGCLDLAGKRGVGPKLSAMDPTPSSVDALFEGGELPSRLPSAQARRDGEAFAGRVLALLQDPAATNKSALVLRRDAETLMPIGTSGNGTKWNRGEQRERTVLNHELRAVAGASFVAAGGVPLIEASLARGLRALDSGELRDGSAAFSELHLAFEAVDALESSPLASALLQCRAAALLCRAAGAERAGDVTRHNAVRALGSMLSAASLSELSSALDVPLLEPVVGAIGGMMFDLISRDPLSFAMVDSLLHAATCIASVSGQLARLVATASSRGIQHIIPTSMAIVLMQHAHEQQANRFDGPGGMQQHAQPICAALEGLYVLSLHFDLRVVRIGEGDGDETNSLDSAIGEYADYLHGFVHHAIESDPAKGFLKRLMQFKRGVQPPPFDPQPPPVESMTEQHRRLMQYAHSLQLARQRVREQREERRERGVGPASARSEAARQRGNDLIRGGDAAGAAEAYTESLSELTGFEMEREAAWPLVLAHSNRSEALLQLGRYEAALEDVTNGWVLLERFGHGIEGGDPKLRGLAAERIREKLQRREEACNRELEAAQRGAARVEAAQRAAAERAKARAARRRRAKEARAARRAREQAEEAAALDEAMAAELAAMPPLEAADDEAECIICQEGAEHGPLEDPCGHGHLLHAGCAAMWCGECLKLQRKDPKNCVGPHCPACRRPI